MKQLVWIFLLGFAFCQAQSTEIYEIEYDSGKGFTQLGAAFNIPVCEKNVIETNWRSWIKNRAGKISILDNVMGNMEASEVNFHKEIFNVFFDVLDTENSDSLTLVNIFQFPNGSYVTKKSQPEFYVDFETSLQEFAYETKKSCVRYDLEQANKYQTKLNNDYVNLQRKKGRLGKIILNLENRVLKNQDKIIQIKDQLVNLESQIENTGAGKVLSKLLKKKSKSEKSLIKSEEIIIDSKNEVKELEQEIIEIQAKIQEKDQQLLAQKEVIGSIQESISRIVP